MKKALIISAVIIAACLLYIDQKAQYDRNYAFDYFRMGDTLYPDYVCPDTLIVTDPVGLNTAYGAYDQGGNDYGDEQLDSILHLYTETISTNQ